MASKQQLTQVDYSAMVTLSDPALGFVTLGAKSDGLYIKLPGRSEEKIVTAANFKTAYDSDIVGLRNNSNTLFTLSEAYLVGTTKVFLNGLRLQRGNNADYIETGTTQITFNYPITSSDLLLVDYIKF